MYKSSKTRLYLGDGSRSTAIVPKQYFKDFTTYADQGPLGVYDI